MNLKQIQKEVWQNKLNKGFNTTNVEKEFCFLYGEVAEAFDAYRKKKDDLNEELADIAIYLLGLSEMLGFDLEDEILKKVSKNKKRVYKNVDGTNIRVSDWEEYYILFFYNFLIKRILLIYMIYQVYFYVIQI